MRIPVFELERVQSLYENTVEHNLTESGFHPLRLDEVLTPEQLATLAESRIGYGQTNGSAGLRQRIAALYPGQSATNVLVTNGSAEANYVACHTLLEPGDEVVMMVPNYMQIWGVVEELGATPKAFHLREEAAWAPDLDELRALVGPRTKMVAVCNPSNPTGAVLSRGQMREIVAVAERVGAWVYADEVYRGAELAGEETPSFIGLGERVLAAGGLSKAYALPGLRVGWLVGPPALIADTWAYHDYTSITAGILSNRIAEVALGPEQRPRILARNRSLLAANLGLLRRWLEGYGSTFHTVHPRAGAMAFLRYSLPANSSELSDWLRTTRSVFVLAGDVFGMDGYLRLGIGGATDHLAAGLERLAEGLEERFGV